MKHIVSFSGGKDSTAMLLHMMELKYPIDVVIFLDTGMEFPALYEHINKVRKIVEENNIEFKVLKADKSFEYFLLDKEFYSKKYDQNFKGYGWARPHTRWCTKELKVNPLNAYFKEHFKNEQVITYVGIAADELYRLERETNKQANHNHPLVDWGWTEADALQYCYDKGFDFGGLYKIFKRVSCWCCPLQSMKELRKLYENYPELWKKLEELDNKNPLVYKQPEQSVTRLGARFALEREREAQGLTTNPHTKEFRTALKELYSNIPLPPPIIIFKKPN